MEIKSWTNLFSEDGKILCDFSNTNIKQYHIDTRDFHIIEDNEDILKTKSSDKKYTFDYDIIKKYPDFFNTPEEIKQLIERYYKESDGKRSWRMFSLDFEDSRVISWNFKYIRIYLVPEGLVVCNSYNKAIPKRILKSPVKKKYLNLNSYLGK
jgi:hypothetical protein